MDIDQRILRLGERIKELDAERKQLLAELEAARAEREPDTMWNDLKRDLWLDRPVMWGILLATLVLVTGLKQLDCSWIT